MIRSIQGSDTGAMILKYLRTTLIYMPEQEGKHITSIMLFTSFTSSKWWKTPMS